MQRGSLPPQASTLPGQPPHPALFPLHVTFFEALCSWPVRSPIPGPHVHRMRSLHSLRSSWAQALQHLVALTSKGLAASPGSGTLPAGLMPSSSSSLQWHCGHSSVLPYASPDPSSPASRCPRKAKASRFSLRKAQVGHTNLLPS